MKLPVNTGKSVILLGVVCKRTQWLSEGLGSSVWLWARSPNGFLAPKASGTTTTTSLWKMPVTSSPFPEHSLSCTSASTSSPLSLVPGSLSLILTSALKAPSRSPETPGLVSAVNTQQPFQQGVSRALRGLLPAPSPPGWLQTFRDLTSHLLHTAFKLHHSPLPSHDLKLKSLTHFYFFLLSLKISIQLFHLLYNILSFSGNENKNHREARKSQLPLPCSGEASGTRKAQMFTSSCQIIPDIRRPLASPCWAVCLVSMVSFQTTLDFSGLLRVGL